MASQPPEDRRTEPRNLELWNLTRAAVRALEAAADAHLASGGWRPRVPLPTVRSFNSGWPDLQRSRLFPAEDAPTDYSALVGMTRGNFQPIAYHDVPALIALMDYVRGRDDLRSRLSLTSATGNTEREEQWLTYEVTNLPLSLLDRARATGASTDDELLDLYLQREREWLLDPLPVEYVIPLTLTALDLDGRLVVDQSTRIEPLDAATQAARAPDGFSISGVPEPVVGAATHAIVLSGHQIPNPGPTPRLVSRLDEPLPLAEADLVCEALRVVTDKDVGYSQVLRRPLGWADLWVHDLPPLTTVATLRRYPERFDNYGWLREPDPIGHGVLQELPTVVAALRAAPARLRLAARRLSLATTRPDADDRTVDACIGLEALLGDKSGELSHRLALRATVVLATRPADHPADAHAIYDLVKKVYKHRSAVVHGAPGDKSRTLDINGWSGPTADVAVMLLREVLADALRRPGDWRPASLDDEVLTALAQRAGPAGPSEQTDDAG